MIDRLKQRFNNFQKAYNLLKSVFENKSINDLSILEKEGVIQRFEYTYELAWKTLKDYFGLTYSSHRSVEDCLTTNYVYQYCKSMALVKN